MRYSILGVTVQQVKAIGATAIKEAPNTHIIFATLTNEQVAKLKAQGAIVNKVSGVKAAVMPSPRVPTPVAAAPVYSPEELVWATGLEDLRLLTEPPLYGEGFNVAVIGTGIRKTHQMINGRVMYEKNFTTDTMEDKFNHDTAVASIIITIAPLCNILNYKVLNDKGEGTEEEVTLALDDILALYEARQEITPLAINLSLGSPDNGNPNTPMRIACRAIIERGIWIGAAAGNDGPSPSTILSPACEKYVFAVGSAKYNNPYVVSDFSSRGPTKEGLVKPDALFFGEDIIVASSISDTATIAKTGTSFTVPFLSALAVLYHEGWRAVTFAPVGEPRPWGRFPELEELERPPDIKTLLDKYIGAVSAKPLGVVTGKDNSYGYGMIMGDMIATALGLKPAVFDISVMLSSIAPILVLGLLGMLMGSMTKGLA